jgi:plastocyanin
MLNYLARTSFSLSIVLIAAAIGLVFAGISMTGEAMAVNTVSMGDNFFSPQSIAVPAGSAIEWRNDGNLPHTSTADGGAWDSGLVLKTKTFSQAFATAGTFTYNCAVHPEMVGTVVVEAAAQQPTPTPAPTAAPAAAAANSPAAAPAAIPAAPAAGTLPVGGGPPLAEDWFQGAMVLAILGGALALVGAAALAAAARSGGARPA